MLKKLLFYLTLCILLVSCSNSKYDSAKCDSYIQKYCYETKFSEDSDGYHKQLREISQEEYTDIINQLKSIIKICKVEYEQIYKLETVSEQKEKYEELMDRIMIIQYVHLNGLVGDALSRGLLSEENKNKLNELEDLTKDLGNYDTSIKRNIYK